MKTIETILIAEKYQLETMVKEAQKRLQTAPKGKLRIVKKGSGVEYYYKDEGSGRKNDNGRYMKKSEIKLVKGLAQRDHDIHVVKQAGERIKAIDAFLKQYNRTNLAQMYGKISTCRKELIIADVLSDEDYIRQWQTVEYRGKPFSDEFQEIITEKGERVRSKSEKIIADKLHALGIPYRYEYPLILEGHIKLYPDFMILRMPDRKEVYLEHFGMMDDLNYIDAVIYKLNMYEKNGIYPGVNLFITHETSKYPLNTRVLEELIRKWFYSE